MARGPPEEERTPLQPAEENAPFEEVELPVISRALSQTAEISRPVGPHLKVDPRKVERGVIVFDLDGTILDDIGLISHVAGDVMNRAFGTPADEARIHYLATTGLPFEAQLAQLYPEAPAALRAATSRTFHERKIQEAYAHVSPFPEIPKVLKLLSQDRWTLVISTGAETEMADLVLEREGLRYWFDDVLGSAEGTKREHLQEYRRRFPDVPIFLVGDSRFDMEAASSDPAVIAIGRASSFHGWSLTPSDLKRWGARWADYSLAGLPKALPGLERAAARQTRPTTTRRRRSPRPKK